MCRPRSEVGQGGRKGRDAMKARNSAVLIATLLFSGALIPNAVAQQKSPEQIALQAGSVKGSATACEVATAAYESRVMALFEHLAKQGASAPQLTETFNKAATQTEKQQLAYPTISCDDFKDAFRTFLINKPGWTPSQGWRGL